ncbi:hypothetical protein CLOSTHATH_05378 [Hungatella hathewayi DSM 13479]|uniref:Uncharacterized protein n=1 Tax=Hungatella hathewayi DSM 13479 TaxID=566550 RepID=D3AP27_9FIRM|nr:hypothetical protein CLOSTHATH_05378 [Hungatella hathewayi DSM 13479]
MISYSFLLILLILSSLNVLLQIRQLERQKKPLRDKISISHEAVILYIFESIIS